MIRQALAETVKSEHPGTGPAQGMLEICSETGHPRASLPVLPHSVALESISTDKSRMLLFHVAEAGHVNAIRPMSESNLIFIPGDKACRAAAHTMIH